MIVCGLVLMLVLFGKNSSSAEAAAGQASFKRLASGPVEYSGYWQYERCESCHKQVSELSHPVHIRPSMSMPVGFELEDGRLACKTCHRGQSAAEHAQSRRSHDSLLRGSRRGREFCLNCHDQANSTPVPVMHGMVLGKIHGSDKPMPAEIGFASTGFSKKPAFTRRPVTSETCLSCHQGAGGPSIGHGHPYGISYTSKFAGLKGIRHMGLKSKSQLDSRIRLFNNKVECLSCHSPFSDKSHMLVMDNPSGQLCRACHQVR